MKARVSGRIRRPLVGIACLGLLSLSACDIGGDGEDNGSAGGGGGEGAGGQGQADPDALVATLATPEDTTVIPSDSPAERAEGTSTTLFESAPVVVLAAPEEQLRGASAAVALGVPALVDGPGTTGELERLGTEVALALGPVADPGIDVLVPEDDAALAELLGTGDAVTVTVDEAAARVGELDGAAPQLLVPSDGTDGTGPSTDESSSTTAPTLDDAGAGTTAAPEATTHPPLESDRDELPQTAAPEPQDSLAVLTTGSAEDLAALGSALVAGAEVVVVPEGDPRATSDSVQAMAQLAPGAVVGLGEEFGDAETLAWRARTAATGVELPGGGQLVLPGKTYVALYGTPGVPVLGVLGEQSVEETITRAEEHADLYRPLTDNEVVPSLEIIATVASEFATEDGSYSNRLPIEQLRPLVELAGEHGQYVVLDLQPGRTDFTTQAQYYEELLMLPHVGLALDPEWRLRPDQVHLQQIGQVDVEEVNEVVTYLADLTRDHDLPQKFLVLHQFQIRMIPDADDVDRSRSEVAVLIHADGQGSHGDKFATWEALHAASPSIEHWGWKNFYDEDVPGPFTPEETMQVVPTPDFISYQ